MARAQAFFVVFFLLAFCAFAQKNTGTIEGVIEDIEGRPISGAFITVSSSSLIGGSISNYSDEWGHYRISALASGSYEARAELPGFQTVIRRSIQLSAGQTLIVDFSLDISRVEEVVEVTKEPPLIDVSTTAVSFTVPSKIIESLPKGQKIQNLIALTPGVRDEDLMFEDRLAAYGTPNESHSSFSIDGVNVAGTRTFSGTGGIYTDFSYNWIEEVHVTGIGAPAEYGGFVGLTANFITRSGSNQLHGLLETFYMDENFVDTNQPVTGPKTPFTTYEVATQLGGPIFRDKLWFFAGMEYSKLENAPPGGLSAGSNVQPQFITKLNYKLDESNSFQGFFHRNEPSLVDSSTPDVLPEAVNRFQASPTTWNTNWISILGAQTNFEGRLGGLYDRSTNDEENPDLPGHFDLGNGVYSINSRGGAIASASRFQADAIFSHYASDFLQGNHDFRFGVEFERSSESSETYYNGGLFYHDYLGTPSLRYSISGQEFEGDTHRTSIFAQDEWSITDRLQWSLGVRWDHNRGITNKGTVFATDPVAPRIGFVWTLDKNHRTALKAHFGDYYDALRGQHFFFLTDNGNQIRITEQIDQHGQWIETFRSNNEFDQPFSNLKQPFVRQFTIGLDHVLPGNIPLGVHFIDRRFKNFLGLVSLDGYEPVSFVNPFTGEIITIYNRLPGTNTVLYENPAGLYRDYKAFEIFSSKQFGSKVTLSGSLVFSRSSENFQNPDDFVIYDTPNTRANASTISIDNYSWKLFGTYALPWGFNAGWFYRHESGVAWRASTRVRNVTEPFTQFLEPCCRRENSQNLVDLRLEKEFSVYKGQLRFTADIFNLFNSAVVLFVRTRIEQGPLFGQPSHVSTPRRLRLGVRYTF